MLAGDKKIFTRCWATSFRKHLSFPGYIKCESGVFEEKTRGRQASLEPPFARSSSNAIATREKIRHNARRGPRERGHAAGEWCRMHMFSTLMHRISEDFGGVLSSARSFLFSGSVSLENCGKIDAAAHRQLLESQEGLGSLARAGNDHLRRKTWHSYLKSSMATPLGTITFTFIKPTRSVIIIAHHVPRKFKFISPQTSLN